jgi:hypothetical protein
VPVLNVDGYLHTFESPDNRLWRKSRRANGDGTYGVDLNRNWDEGHWYNPGCGISSRTSSDSYGGTGPFSEPEVQAVVSLLESIRGDGGLVSAAIDWHSYGQVKRGRRCSFVAFKSPFLSFSP